MITRAEADSNNQSAKFWLYEEPEVMETARNCFRYYPKAGRLTIHLPDYIDRKGEQRPGKGTSINLACLADAPEVLERIIEILNELKPEN